jgi:hypothetical protein
MYVGRPESSARLDPPDKPAPAMNNTRPAATVLAVCLNPEHTFSKGVQAMIQLRTGLGVEGDAHSGRTVQRRSRPSCRTRACSPCWERPTPRGAGPERRCRAIDATRLRPRFHGTGTSRAAIAPTRLTGLQPYAAASTESVRSTQCSLVCSRGQCTSHTEGDRCDASRSAR